MCIKVVFDAKLTYLIDDPVLYIVHMSFGSNLDKNGTTNHMSRHTLPWQQRDLPQV